MRIWTVNSKWRVLATCTLATTLGACSELLETEQHFISNGRVTVTGTAPVPLILITSSNFTATEDPLTGERTINFVTSDTTTLTLPFDRTYSFGRTDRFLVKVANSDSTSTATVVLSVFLDGVEDLRQGLTMQNSSYQYLYYRFN
jgi:hypothetical protein